MKVIKHNFSGKGRNVRIIPLGDTHIGDPNSDINLLKQTINYILDNEDTYTVLMGDLIDNATTFSVGDTYEARFSPMQQIQLICDLLRPLAEEGKIMGILEGNHERRTEKMAGIRPMQFAAAELGLSHLYSPDTIVMFITVGFNSHNTPITYTSYFTHGHGGGKKAGSKIGKLEDYRQIVDCDFYVQGHTHTPGTFKTTSYRPCTQKGTLDIVEHTFINLGSTLTYDGSYADKMGLTPAANAFPVIHLSGKSRRVSVKL